MRQLALGAAAAMAFSGLLAVEPLPPGHYGPPPGEGRKSRQGRRKYSAPVLTTEPQRADYPSRQTYRAAMRLWNERHPND